ncbi:HlyD family efflux transporter periplasmic adaptor subunit [Stenotrophomonas geniculata]|jgi:Multidrug resistance efflux pump|uniref:HlyD family secretion protein n=1 Tax=Stenotrophomonas geniculata TaxID=86188 RepID=UPI001CC91F49|nr:HlyD family efflux transporter periplasmic adaptor subunit [Stenotrophomonas geniculata]MCI1052161.1 HlyD family efflux transporter periplasmic adaptor subunit [Stenotrophomonas maltophilia]WNF09677.1 HlyD family efflux transporter periplasmic adaptor subunit [Stenotrophomonas geniculata]
MSGLFRKEAIDAQRRSWLGGVSLAQPLRFWILAVFAAMAASAIVGFLYLGEYSRRSRVMGELVPDLGLSTVVAPSAGVVARLDVEEGDHVRRQDGLLTINVPRVTSSGQDAVSTLLDAQRSRMTSVEAMSEFQDRQLAAQQEGAKAQRSAMLRELSQIEAEIHTRGEQVRIGRETLARFRSVEDERYVSLVQINQQEQSILEAVNAQQALQRQATSIRRNLAELEQRLAEIPHQRLSAKAASERDLAALSQETVRMEADGELLLRAPVTGLVANRLVEAGQAVQPGQPILSLLPQGSELRAQLLVPSSAIGFVKSGDRVLLRYQAYPYQKFGAHEGTVIRISRSALTGAQEGSDAKQSLYRVLVSLDQQGVLAYGKIETLRPGMQLEADIMGERRKLYEWLLEPLYSVTGKLRG